MTGKSGDGASGSKLPPDSGGPSQRVVILGGGFAGVYTAKYLTRLLGRRRDVHVELLSEENYFVFQPLLPEVAAGGINPNHVVNPIRDLVPKARFRWCTINGVDTERKVVRVAQGEGRALVDVPYDHLVFALGKISDFSSMPGVNEHSLAMKDLDDAFRLRNHVFRCLELADIENDPAEKRSLLTFVVAGGGFSGVETLGELSEMLHRVVPSFQNVQMGEVRLCLVHSRDRILPEMAPELGEAAHGILRKRNIEMIFGARVRAATRHGIYLSNGQFLPTRTFVCTVGNAANPVVKAILAKGGFEEGKVDGRGIGVFATDRSLRCAGRPGYWAVGDNAGVPHPQNEGELCPPTAQFAIRQAQACAHNILASIDGRQLDQLRFGGIGMLASLGQRAAVAEVWGVRFSGFFAWAAWRGFYLTTLPGVVRKLRVALDWTLDLFFPRDIAQVLSAPAPRPRLDHYEPGEIIINKHEIGRELYIVRNGEVEVFQPAENGAAERIVTTLGKGEVFGEKALLEDTLRTASVRAKTPVDLLVISRENFSAMVAQFPVLDDYFHRLMQERYPAEFPGTVPLAQVIAQPVRQPGTRRGH
ncbi:MAG: FAD-dependent oxidoreductase [Bradyrhizobiaceae bacterium]|nr:FAD-dependent oxidoreductase [Bradyrhizobiaceae bacterium]